MKKHSRPFIIFYILVAYVFIQFGWWAYHISDLNKEVYNLRTEILPEYSGQDLNSSEFLFKEKALEEKLAKRMWMVIGEGTVFLIILILGVYITQRAFKKEVALSHQQKNFLLSVTHELKSPLASIKLYLQTLLKRNLDKNKSEDIISNAINDTERLTNLVENILLSTQIDSSSYPIQKEKVNLSDLISDFLSKATDNPNTNHPRYGRTSLWGRQLASTIEPDIYLNADKMSWVSILQNLLENAIKCSPHNSTITIDLTKTNNTIKLSISDEGKGIADEEKPNIFKKFYRIENEETRKSKGTGLGLYIVKYLVEKHNGHISVKDNTPTGSIFEVTLKV